MDAAILFADILLIAQALGQCGSNSARTGPPSTGSTRARGIGRLGLAGMRVARPGLRDRAPGARRPCRTETALIGFAGAPWTVATYMVEGGASRDFRLTRSWAYRDPGGFAALIDLIAEATIAYLSAQIAAGAEAVQLFDSWAGVLPEREFERWVIAPTRRIAAALKERFPARAGHRVSARRRAALRALCGGKRRRCRRARHGCAGRIRARQAAAASAGAGQSRSDRAAGRRRGDGEGGRRHPRARSASGPFVFNLGHGVLPQTPPEHVAALAAAARRAGCRDPRGRGLR